VRDFPLSHATKIVGPRPGTRLASFRTASAEWQRTPRRSADPLPVGWRLPPR